MRPDLLLAHLDLIEMSRPSVVYCREQGINFADVVPACGGVFLAEVEADGRRFAPCEGGTLAAWVDVLAEDAETVVDVAAWPVEQPEVVWTLGDTAPALGMAHAVNPATFSFGGALHLHRTPLCWLRAGCRGAAILDRSRGARWLLDLEAPRIATEDRQHAGDLVAAMDALLGRERFVVPSRKLEAA